MKILILTEGGNKIGFGHIARCIALYQAFCFLGVKPTLIINGDKSILNLMHDINFRFLNWGKENKKVLGLIKNKDIVIIDSYLADKSFYKKVAYLSKTPVFLDDNNRLDFPRGVIINGSVYGHKLTYKNNGLPHFLGPGYALLRKEFWKQTKRNNSKQLKSILIIFGGYDFKNMTTKIIKFLNRVYPQIKRNVIIGKNFNHINEINKLKDHKVKFILKPDTSTLKSLMLESDMAISAGGQTIYELANVGLPTIGICVARNQRLNLKSLEQSGFIENAGQYSSKRIFINLKESIEHMTNYRVRIKQSKIGQSLIDGKGALRISRSLIKLATQGDQGISL